MKDLLKKFTILTITIFSFCAPLLAHAEASSNALDEMALPLGMFAVVGILSLAAFGYWIWMLVDLITRDVDNKLIWVILLVFVGVIGAILYHFIARNPHIKETQHMEAYSEEE